HGKDRRRRTRAALRHDRHQHAHRQARRAQSPGAANHRHRVSRHPDAGGAETPQDRLTNRRMIMARKWLWAVVPGGAPVGAGGTWVAGGGMARNNKATLPADAAARDPAAVAVTAEPVVVRDVPRTVQAVGSLHAYEEVILSAKVEGRVRRIMHEVADRVSPS